MCDYSLHGHPNRLAQEGDQLVVAMFPGGTKGFISRSEFDQRRTRKREHPALRWSWTGIVEYFTSARTQRPPQPLTAVCIPPGARIRLDDIPEPLQAEWDVSRAEEVRFTQLSASAYTHRDGVRFRNGAEALLQRLKEGQPATVLSLGAEDDGAAIEAPRGAAFEFRQVTRQ